MSPRECADRRLWVVGADPSADPSVGRTAATIALFAVIALPIGMLISSANTRKQESAERDAFRRAGLDWNKRFQYPK